MPITGALAGRQTKALIACALLLAGLLCALSNSADRGAKATAAPSADKGQNETLPKEGFPPAFVGDPKAPVKLVVYYPINHESKLFVDYLKGLPAKFPGKVYLEVYDENSEVGEEKWAASGLGCGGVLVNGQAHWGVRRNGKTESVDFVQRMDDYWYHEDLEAVIASQLADPAQIPEVPEREARAGGSAHQPTCPDKENPIVASTPVAHQPLALQRYRMLEQVGRQVGGFPLYRSLEDVREALFPEGRSDKVYLYGGYGWGTPLPGDHPGGELLCFISQGTRVKRLYSARLKQVWFQPPPRRIPVRSVLDYFSTWGVGRHPDRTMEGDWPRTYRYAFTGRLSRQAQRDLASQQDLVVYWYDPTLNVLFAGALRSIVANSDWSHGFNHLQAFDLDENPDRWFSRYGLPTPDRESPASAPKP